MKELILHTEYLLSIHECVIIPGLGGFISQIKPAHFDENTSIWFPPQKQISFNPSLFHNDGLLIGSYIDVSDISYSEAFVLVEKSVLEFKKTLKKAETVQFGRIGSFTYDDNGALLFSPYTIPYDFSKSTYGLQAEPISLLADLKQSAFSAESRRASSRSKKRKSDTIYIPLKKRFLYQGIAVAAVVGLFMLFSTPIYVDNTQKTNYAKLLAPIPSSTLVHDNTLAVNDKETDKKEVTPKVPVTIPSEETQIKKIDKPDPTIVAIAEKKQEKPEKQIQPEKQVKSEKSSVKETSSKQVAANNNKFFIIIGSFPTEKDAKNFAETAKAKGLPNANVLVRDGRFRVYANSFSSRNEANQYMTSFKSEHKATHPNAWLYIAK